MNNAVDADLCFTELHVPPTHTHAPALAAIAQLQRAAEAQRPFSVALAPPLADDDALPTPPPAAPAALPGMNTFLCLSLVSVFVMM